MPEVRVTMFENPIEVPEDEVEVLRVQGLLHEETSPAAETTVEPATRPAAKATAKKAGDQS